MKKLKELTKKQVLMIVAATVVIIAAVILVVVFTDSGNTDVSRNENTEETTATAETTEADAKTEPDETTGTEDMTDVTSLTGEGDESGDDKKENAKNEAPSDSVGTAAPKEETNKQSGLVVAEDDGVGDSISFSDLINQSTTGSNTTAATKAPANEVTETTSTANKPQVNGDEDKLQTKEDDGEGWSEIR